MFYSYKQYLFITILLTISSFCYTEYFSDQNYENLFLKNIEQITYSSMGFEKAGEAYFSPDGKTVIFQAVPKNEKHYQIYAMNLSERVPHMVSTGRGACTCAYFRPDNKKIIFASSHEDPYLNSSNQEAPGYQREGGNYSWKFTPYMNIYEANPDGSDLKALTYGAAYHAECAYSPDGLQVVFASNMDGHMNLYTMNSDGSNVKAVTHDKNIYNGGPFFSPDNNKIVYRADHEKRDYLQIFTINSDGTEKRQITLNNAVNWAPYWYPSGEVIAYTTSIHGHSRYEIYLVNIKTGLSCRLTNSPAFNGLPSFSKDGSRILWTSKRSDDKTCQIFMADFSMPENLKNIKE